HDHAGLVVCLRYERHHTFVPAGRTRHCATESFVDPGARHLVNRCAWPHRRSLVCPLRRTLVNPAGLCRDGSLRRSCLGSSGADLAAYLRRTVCTYGIGYGLCYWTFTNLRPVTSG